MDEATGPSSSTPDRTPVVPMPRPAATPIRRTTGENRIIHPPSPQQHPIRPLPPENEQPRRTVPGVSKRSGRLEQPRVPEPWAELWCRPSSRIMDQMRTFAERVRALTPAPWEHDDDLLRSLYDAQLGSRHADLAARWMQSQGSGFYTIGSAGHEGNAAVAAALQP